MPASPLAPLTRLSRVGRFCLLLVGLFLYGLSLRLMLNAGVGVAPWDVLHVGVTNVWPLSVGMVGILTGALLVLYTALGLGEKVGVGTVLNVVLIGIFMDLLAGAVPYPQTWPGQWTQFLLGVLLIGFATGAYVGAGLGAGPRDSLMLGLHRRYGWPVARVRTGVELLVLGLGVLLGGPVGWGTLAFALLVGPSVGLGLRLFGLQGRKTQSAKGEPLPE